jgi:hypothetical protein
VFQSRLDSSWEALPIPSEKLAKTRPRPNTGSNPVGATTAVASRPRAGISASKDRVGRCRRRDLVGVPMRLEPEPPHEELPDDRPRLQGMPGATGAAPAALVHDLM